MNAKKLTMGFVILLAVCLLAVSLMTSFDHDADADPYWPCTVYKCVDAGDAWHCTVHEGYCHTSH